MFREEPRCFLGGFPCPLNIKEEGKQGQARLKHQMANGELGSGWWSDALARSKMNCTARLYIYTHIYIYINSLSLSLCLSLSLYLSVSVSVWLCLSLSLSHTLSLSLSTHMYMYF